MRLSEIIVESSTITERPMGILKKAGLGLASKISSKAAGKLASGNEANELRKDYDFYLGSSNQKATANSLIQFLKGEGHSTTAAQQEISKIPGADQDPNMPLPKNTIDQILSKLGSDRISKGQVAPVSSGSAGDQAQSKTQPAVAPTSLRDLKNSVSKLDPADKQEIINMLKKDSWRDKTTF
jgi:hypothetical protein